MTGRTDKFAGSIIHLEIFHAEPALLGFIPLMALVHRSPVSTGILKTDALRFDIQPAFGY